MDDAHREQARDVRPDDDSFATPRWLEQSFVLPLTGAGVTAVPHQHAPHHDDADRLSEHAEASALRPPRDEVDFARLVRRAEMTRAAHRTATVSAGLSGLALIGYLLTPSLVVLALLVAVAIVAAVAFTVRMRLDTAPIPHVER